MPSHDGVLWGRVEMSRYQANLIAANLLDAGLINHAQTAATSRILENFNETEVSLPTMVGLMFIEMENNGLANEEDEEQLCLALEDELREFFHA